MLASSVFYTVKMWLLFQQLTCSRISPAPFLPFRVAAGLITDPLIQELKNAMSYSDFHRCVSTRRSASYIFLVELS